VGCGSLDESGWRRQQVTRISLVWWQIDERRKDKEAGEREYDQTRRYGARKKYVISRALCFGVTKFVCDIRSKGRTGLSGGGSKGSFGRRGA
jgi:hypothetical protein